MGTGIVGVERKRTIEQPQSCLVVRGRRAVVVDLAGEQAFISRHAVGRLAARPFAGGGVDPSWKGSDDRGGHFVLNGEDVLELAVVALGPDMPVRRAVDQ